ncbi:MAG: hypothetical protein NVSMB28_17250 [Collimonas sp.]
MGRYARICMAFCVSYVHVLIYWDGPRHEKGFKADIAQVRQEYPQLLTFAGWVKKYTDEH